MALGSGSFTAIRCIASVVPKRNKPRGNRDGQGESAIPRNDASSFSGPPGAAVLATGLTARRASARQAGPFVRKSLLDPQIGPVLDSYKKGIAAMLALPPTDPRNWYRIAFIHELDCPHGNWWFLPWHRGYLGYLECIIRDLSGDPTLRLPYWDWTANPSLPVQFASTGTVLNPANPAYIARRRSGFQTPRLPAP